MIGVYDFLGACQQLLTSWQPRKALSYHLNGLTNPFLAGLCDFIHLHSIDTQVIE
jgi:hypothetical protein